MARTISVVFNLPIRKITAFLVGSPCWESLLPKPLFKCWILSKKEALLESNLEAGVGELTGSRGAANQINSALRVHSENFC